MVKSTGRPSRGPRMDSSPEVYSFLCLQQYMAWSGSSVFWRINEYGLLHCQGWVLPLLSNPSVVIVLAMLVDVLQPSIFLHPWILSPLKQESQNHLLSHMCSWQMCFQRGGQGIQWRPERTAAYCYGSPGESFSPRALLSAQRASIPSPQVRAAYWRGGLYVGSWQGENLNYRTNTYRGLQGGGHSSRVWNIE